MGSNFSSPYAFRRAINSLHVTRHPVFDKNVGSHKEEEDAALFWRTLFCSRLSAVEFASFWTVRDVRQLRLYHPDRLAAVLFAAMEQIDAFLAIMATNSHGGRDVEAPASPSSLSRGAASVEMKERVGYTQSSAPDTGKDQGSNPGAPPIDFTAVINALWFISGSLPYCFEDITKLESLLHEENEEAVMGDRWLSIIYEQQKSESRIVSPFAAEFAYHFFVRGDACVNGSASASGIAAGSGKDDRDDNYDNDGTAAHSFSPYPPLLGVHLIEGLLQLFFLPGFTTIASCQLSEVVRKKASQESLVGELELLSDVHHAMEAKRHEMAVSGSGSVVGEASERLRETEWAAALMPLNEEWRMAVLRGILLALSAPIFSSRHKDDDAASPKEKGEKLNHLVCWREKTATMMAGALFGGKRKSLSILFCVSLLHVVRCYPKMSESSSLLKWRSVAQLTPAHVSVLGYALSILALSLNAGPTLKSYCFSAHNDENKEVGDSIPNVFWEVLCVALEPCSSSTLQEKFSSGEALGTSQIPSQGSRCGVRSSCYVEGLVEGLLSLLESPVRAKEEKISAISIPCAPLSLQLLLWVLQRSPVSLDIVGGRPQSLLAFMHSLCVSSTMSSSRFGEGQLALLCLLILMRHPPFLQLLKMPLPSISSGATKGEAICFLRKVRAVMPMLPEKLIIGECNNGVVDLAKQGASADTLRICIYADILVLSLCYVTSPSSPWWFQALYRSVVETLHTLQVYLSRVTQPGAGVLSLCDVLSEHVLLELVSSLNYLSSPKVFKCGPDIQAACQQMVHVVFSIIQTSIGPLRESNGDLYSSIQRVDKQRGGEKLIPIFYGMMKKECVSNLYHLAQMIGVVETNCIAEAVKASLFSSSMSAECLTTNDSLSREPAFNRDHFREASWTGELPSHLHSSAFVSELTCLIRIIIAVSMQLSSHGNMKHPVETCELTLGEGHREELCTEPGILNPTTLFGPLKKQSDLQQSQLWSLLRAAAEVVDAEYRCQAEKERHEGEVASESVRRVVTSGEGSGGLWLLTHLWRQIHLFNLSPPVFDYRSASLLLE